MNDSKLPPGGQPTLPPGAQATLRQDLRRDGRSRELVNHAISMQRQVSTVCALEYLKSHSIPGAVIERVLMDSNRRCIPTIA